MKLEPTIAGDPKKLKIEMEKIALMAKRKWILVKDKNHKPKRK